MRRRGVGVFFAAAAVGVALVPGGAEARHMATPGDINGDGYRDMVLQAPALNVAGQEGAGGIVVLYGSSTGVSPTRRTLITQNTAGVPGGSEKYDAFGSSTAVADLNRDGFADVVVGTPYEDLADADDGMVSVLWGSASGVSGGVNLPAAKVWDQHYYGLDVAAVGGSSAGTTSVLVGAYSGITHFTGPFGRTGTVGGTETIDDTGSAETVALGDLNKDSFPEPVVVTSRRSDFGGVVFVDPVDLPSSQEGFLEGGDGLIAATGDVNGDGYGDLVVGDPDEPGGSGGAGHAGGRVSVWYGSAQGVSPTAAPVHLSQDTAGVPGASEPGDHFGASVAVADLNRDGAAEIIVGSPSEDLSGVYGAGMVTVIPGMRSGVPGMGSYNITQETASVPGGSEDEDFFGTTVAAGDLNKDGRPELLVSAYGENNGQGAAWVLPGGTSRPTGTGSRMLTTSQLGITQPSIVWLGGLGLSQVT